MSQREAALEGKVEGSLFETPSLTVGRQHAGQTSM